MNYLLGIDIGTSSAKAILFDPETAQIRAVANSEYPIDKPTPDRAEQDPESWWRATIEVVRRVCTETAADDIAGIGFSGQMHGTVLLDEKLMPLHPAIIWADQRSGQECDTLVEPLGAERYTAIAGTLPAAGFMGPTIAWLAGHHPHLLEQTRVVLFPKDYVRLQLTGEVATEASDAASSGVFDIRRGIWASDILQAAGLDETLFPTTILQSTDIAGHLTQSAAESLGLAAGIPVAAGCADQPAQALGNNLIAPGKASVTTGTGGQVFVPLHEVVGTDPRLHIFNHAVPDTWYVLGAILSAGLSLRWLRDIVGLSGEPDAYRTLSAEAAQVAPGADGLIFLPYLAGERTPHMDPHARGSFIGLGLHHGREHLARAVMEGVAFALRDALEIGLHLSGPVETIIAAGGGAESAVWRQIQADVFGVPLRQTKLVEQASVGAALLAGAGAGLYTDLHEACSHTVKYGPVTEPDPARQKQYAALYDHFRELYPHLRNDFHRLSAPS